MCKDHEHPAAEPLKLAADPWAFWLILQSRFSSCPQPATGSQAAGGGRNQISFLAQAHQVGGKPHWPDKKTLTEEFEPLGLNVELATAYEKSTNMFGTGSLIWDTDMWSADRGSAEELLEKQVSVLNLLRKKFRRLKISRPIKPQLRDALFAAIRIVRARIRPEKKNGVEDQVLLSASWITVAHSLTRILLKRMVSRT